MHIRTILAALAVFLLFGGSGLASGLPEISGTAGKPPVHTLSFHNTHTGEQLDVTYRQGNRYQPEALSQVSHLLRDHRNGHVHKIDNNLLDLLYDLKVKIEEKQPGLRVRYDIISGYRSRASNEMLRAAGGGQAKKSQHIEGKAIDIRVRGVDSAVVRDLAWCMQRGGVGYYRGSDFVHVDTGRVRYWNWAPNSGTCGADGNS